MTTYTITEAQRHQLLDAVTASELDDVREVAEKMLQSLAPMAAPSTHPVTTGWDNGLMQDYDKGLSRALSEKLDSREVVRNVFTAAPNTSHDERRMALIAYGDARESKDASAVASAFTNALYVLCATPSTNPEMSDDLHIAYMAGYNSGKRAESNQWQPIETAPKDGTSVLTWCDPYVEICFMHGSVWITGRCDDFGEAETPTHWMPLPPPAK